MFEERGDFWKQIFFVWGGFRVNLNASHISIASIHISTQRLTNYTQTQFLNTHCV